MKLRRKHVIFLVLLIPVSYYLLVKSDIEPQIKVRKVVNSAIDENVLLSGKSVFLVDTRNAAKGSTEKVKLTSRVACAIESAARAEIDRNVILLYTSQERLNNLQDSPLIEALLSYPNVYFLYANVTKLSVGSPMEDFFKQNKLSSSHFPLEHFADATRLVVIWKYGGVYIDSDIIVRRSFDSVPSNFLCRLTYNFGNGVMAFNPKERGREILELFMEEFGNNFNGSDFSANGPYLMTRIIRKMCGKDDLDEIMKMKSCGGLNFLKDEECYAIGWKQWQDLMTENAALAEKVMKQVNESLVVHFWNHLSQNHTLKMNSTAPYLQLARKYCPTVIDASSDIF